ncbi:hypothetical protein TNCV_1860921 [Trichonephila clavipes]|nr:hypothetical protein TNCV_1860921 [Trichonephila clavipes]
MLTDLIISAHLKQTANKSFHFRRRTTNCVFLPKHPHNHPESETMFENVFGPVSPLSFPVQLPIAYTRAFYDGPRNFKPGSSDVDDTGAGTPSPNYHTTPTEGRLNSGQI